MKTLFSKTVFFTSKISQIEQKRYYKNFISSVLSFCSLSKIEIPEKKDYLKEMVKNTTEGLKKIETTIDETRDKNLKLIKDNCLDLSKTLDTLLNTQNYCQRICDLIIDASTHSSIKEIEQDSGLKTLLAKAYLQKGIALTMTRGRYDPSSIDEEALKCCEKACKLQPNTETAKMAQQWAESLKSTMPYQYKPYKP